MQVKRVDTTTNQLDVMGRNIYKIKDLSVEGTTFNNADLQAAGIESVSLERGNRFRSRKPRKLVAHAQWISRLFEFENPCDGIKLKLTTFQYFRHQVRVFYRPRPVGFTGDLNLENWRGIRRPSGYA